MVNSEGLRQLSRFQSQGYWTVRSGVVAKKVKNSCVLCLKVDPKLLEQVMGSFPNDMLEDLFAWSCCRWICQARFRAAVMSTRKPQIRLWGLIIENVNSGASNLDVFSDYSTDSVLITLKRFLSNRGRPGVIDEDPGNQQGSESRKLESWLDRMQKGLRELCSSCNFRWMVSPHRLPLETKKSRTMRWNRETTSEVLCR